MPDGDVKITISDYTGKVVRNIAGTKDIGINRIQWNLRGEQVRPPQGFGGFGGGGGGGGGGGFGGGFNFGAALEAGTYHVKLTVNGKDYTTKAVIENDPGILP